MKVFMRFLGIFALPAIIGLALVSCDLLSPPADFDLLEKIDEEIAWSNAEKLTVRIEYDNSNWGTSTPGWGPLTNDTRQGHEFSLEFTPSPEYTLLEWRAYETAKLNERALWFTDAGYYLDGEGVDTDGPEILEQTAEVILPFNGGPVPSDFSSGGRFSFTVNTTVPVTLVPLCRTEPRVTRTIPAGGLNSFYPAIGDIVIYFNGPLDEDSLLFKTAANPQGTITLAGRQNTGADLPFDDISGYYEEPEYSSSGGLFTVTVRPKTEALANLADLEIEVTVAGVKNIYGETMTTEKKFSWGSQAVTSETGQFDSYGAEYLEGSNAIRVSWTADAMGAYEVLASYRVNQGTDIMPIDGVTWTINGVGRLDASGVTRGTAVRGIQEYEIYLDLYAGGKKRDSKSFKIWNFPAMSVDMNLSMIRTQDDLRDLGSGSDVNAVLLNDIVIEGDAYVPIDFSGKFYGNGKTITFNGTFQDSENTGIFGLIGSQYYPSSPEIRDLAVHYANNASAGASARNIGGIAGHALDAAKISNCIVSSASGCSLSSAADSTEYRINMGGIAGQMQNSVEIKNAYSSINLNLINNGDAIIAAGGAVGYISDELTPAAELVLGDIRVTGNVSCLKGEPTAGTFSGNIYSGGVIGEFTGTSEPDRGKISRVSYEGTMKLGRNSASLVEYNYLYGGGIVAYARYPRFESCQFERSGRITVSRDNSYGAYIGGIAGEMHDGLADSEKSLSLLGCTARGDIEVRSGGSVVIVGGVTGYLAGTPQEETIPVMPAKLIYQKQCTYEQGTIYVQSGPTTENSYAGGIAGMVDEHGDFTECYSRAALIEIDVPAGSIYFGGFAGSIQRSSVSDCGNNSPIKMSETGQPATGRIYMGGFVGTILSNDLLTPVILTGCWSRSDVSSRSAGIYAFCTGGLVGYFQGNKDTDKIDRCYASGNVTAVCSSTSPVLFYTGGLGGWVQDGNIKESWAAVNVTARCNESSPTNIYAGGLVGYYAAYAAVSITDCYALGNVLADYPRNTAADAVAGGLAGYINGNSSGSVSVTKSFARGSVSAQSAGDGNVYAGGIAGYNQYSLLSNTVALGASITAKGGSNFALKKRVAARVYGDIYDPLNTPTPAGNYARSDMTLITGESYWNSPPPSETTLAPGDDTSINGADSSNWDTLGFWTGEGSEMEFESAIWDTATVSGMGYPLLKNNRP